MPDLDLCIMDQWETAIFAFGFVVIGMLLGALLAPLGRHQTGSFEQKVGLRNFGLGCLTPVILAALPLIVFLPMLSPGDICGYAFAPDTVILPLLVPLLPLAAAVTFFFRLSRLSR